MVTGWIGETLNFLVSPLTAIADAINWVAEKIGIDLNAIKNNFSNLLTYLNPTHHNFILSGVLNFLTNIISYLNPFHENFLLSGVLSFLGNIISYLNPFHENFLLTGVLNFLIEILSYINPFHDNFLLKIAFIPEDDFFKNYLNNWDTLLRDKFAVFYQLSDTFKAIGQSIKSTTHQWDGVKIDLSHYGAGEQVIISNFAIVEYGQKVKFWIGGLMYFLTGTWLIRRLSAVLGSGK